MDKLQTSRAQGHLVEFGLNESCLCSKVHSVPVYNVALLQVESYSQPSDERFVENK